MGAFSRALDSGLRILEFLASQPEPQSLTEICNGQALPKSTTHRLLSTLEKRQYVERDRSFRYSLGPKLLELEGAYDPWLRLRRSASPILQELAQRSRATCHLAVLFKGRAVYVDKVNSPRAISMSSRIGSTAALHASSVGKSLLSGLAPQVLDSYMVEHGLPQLTEKTITHPGKLKEELARIREQGYAIDDEEEEVGVICVGAPLHDHNGKIVAAVSVAALSIDVDPDRLTELGNIVREAAARVSARLGYQPAILYKIGELCSAI